ncbi:MAG: beta-ketoacyl-[acyl-carrier-protein] synthase family protein [Planctomycetes bacterium]|nr:beta-ketoacyl-[acyl-carrier-protein] synthase family protein [Planctomycetota bacterium]
MRDAGGAAGAVPEVWITGVGMTCSAGVGREECWDNFLAGRSGIGPIRGYDPAGEPVTVAGELPEHWAAEFKQAVRVPFVRRFNLPTRMSLFAGQEALEQAGLLGGVEAGTLDRGRCGVSMGVGGGPLHYLQPLEEVLRTKPEAADKLYDHYFVIKTMFNAPAGMLSIVHGFEGPSTTASAACASGSAAIAQALDWLRSGRCDLVLAGGADSTITAQTLRAYHAVGALTGDNQRGATASRPFDRTRSGFVMAEGAAALVLETAAHARARGAEHLAVLRGAGLVSEAYKLATPLEDGTGMARAMRSALADAGAAADEVAHISAHAPSTPQGDLAEARGIALAFGDRAAEILVHAPKAVMGHSIGASSAIQAALAALTVQRGVVPPNPHLAELDPEIRLSVSTTPVERPVPLALCNAFGFGGHNVSLLLGA